MNESLESTNSTDPQEYTQGQSLQTEVNQPETAETHLYDGGNPHMPSLIGTDSAVEHQDVRSIDSQESQHLDLTLLSDQEIATQLNVLKQKSDLSDKEMDEYKIIMLEIARRGSLIPKADIEQQEVQEKETAIVKRMKKALELAGQVTDDVSLQGPIAVEIYQEFKVTEEKSAA